MSPLELGLTLRRFDGERDVPGAERGEIREELASGTEVLRVAASKRTLGVVFVRLCAGGKTDRWAVNVCDLAAILIMSDWAVRVGSRRGGSPAS